MLLSENQKYYRYKQLLSENTYIHSLLSIEHTKRYNDMSMIALELSKAIYNGELYQD
jgi:hypothetical protein